MLDEPTMSDQTLLLSVEDLINLAMGPIAGNTVDFKMLKTILHILARQMRLLEQKVVLEVGELPQNPVLRLTKPDEDSVPTSSSETKSKETTSYKKKRPIGDIQEEKGHWSPFGDKGEESEESVDSYEMEEIREEAERARDKDIERLARAEREKQRAEAERAKMEQMDPAAREEYQKELQKEREQRENAQKLADEKEEKAEKEARAQKELARAEREKAKADKSRLRLEKEKEMAEKEREIAEKESAKMEQMSPSEKDEYQKQLEKDKEERIKALRMAQDEEERVEKEKARAERDKARAEKEKERAEKEKEKMENMSPREKENYQQELEKVKAEREEERKKLEKMDSKERELYEIAQHKERERARFEKMSPSEKAIYEQELQKKQDEKEKVKMENMSPKEREQYMEEKEKFAELEKMSPKERELYEKEHEKEISEREKAKLEKMSPKERERYEKQKQKEIAEKEQAKLEQMSPKEKEKYQKQQQKEKEAAEKEKAKVEKMSPKERQKYEKAKEKEKAEKDSDTSEKEKEKLERMSPKERAKYEKEQQKEKGKADKDSDKSEKERAKLEKMSPKEREKYEKEQQKAEKAKIEKMSPKEREKYEKEKQKEKEKAEKEKAKIEKMSPKEREKYEMEQEKELSEKEQEKLERMSPKERERYEKERQKERGKDDKDSDKSEKERAKLEKMSPKEREAYEKEQQKEKEKAEKQARKELEREKAKMDKMSPTEREKYVKEKEKAEREARDKARADDSAKLSDVVESISEKYDAKLKEKVLVVEKGAGRSIEPRSRRSSIEVVTRSQFALLEAAVEALRENTSPLPALTLPDNNQLRSDLAEGNLSLTDAMTAMQVSARVQAAEMAIARLGGVLTKLAGQGVIPDGEEGVADGEGGLVPARKTHGKASPSTTSRKSVIVKEPGMDVGSRPSRLSTATVKGVSRPSIISKGPSSMALTQYEMDAALDALRKELMEKVNAITSRALTSAETTANLAKSVVDKMDVALQIDDRISTLNALVADYTEQLAGFDAGLTTQMQSFREQMTQMRGDLTAGLALLESANNNAETAAMLELTERYEELVNGLDNTLLAHQALAAFQDQLNLDFRSLLESVEMLREQKADRDEVIDGLRDKADNERLAGLLRETDFNDARAELDQQLAVCHEKFRKQDAVWVAALKELTGVVQRKAEHTDLMKTRQETTQQLQEIDEKIKRLAFILGEPKAAIITRKLAKDALCAVCLVPALMDPEDATSGKPPRLPVMPPPHRAALPASDEPCVPEWKPPEAPDLRTHTCLRWVGGSHTLLSAAKRGRCEHPVAPPSATHKFLGQGDDGKMYSMETELQPCEECNIPLHCSEGGPCLNIE